MVAQFRKIQPEDAQGVLMSFLVWSALYICIANSPLPLKPKAANLKYLDDLDVRNRLVSFAHGFLIMSLAAYEFYFQPGSCGDATTQYEKNLIYISVGYFLYDFLAMSYYGLLDFAMTFHHGICIVGMMLGVTSGQGGNFIVQGMYIAEVSNTCMHLRVILKHYGLRYTKAYESMEISFILLYIYGRILLGLSVVYGCVTCPKVLVIIKVCSAGLLFQSIHFIFKMVGILKRRFAEISLRKRHRVKSRWFDPLTPEEMAKIGLKGTKEKHIL